MNIVTMKGKFKFICLMTAAAISAGGGICVAGTTAVDPGLAGVPASGATTTAASTHDALYNAVNGQNQKADGTNQVASLDGAAGDTLGSALSVFIQSTFSTDYITPRGLHVSDKGVTWQPLTIVNMDLYNGKGFLTDVTAYGGIWQDWNSQQHASNGAFQEIDPFFGVKTTLAKTFTVDLQYVDFISPNASTIHLGQNDYVTEQNLSLKLSYHDTFFKDFSFNPYVDPFYAVAGGSTVVTGKSGNTFDVEIGAVPTLTIHAIKKYPITLSFPTWVTVGPKDFWDATGQTNNNFGVLSSGVQLEVPLSFIPIKFGAWSAFAGFQYYNELNDNLMKASTILGTGGHRNIYVGTAGVNVFF